MGKLYTYNKKWEKNIVEILHIYVTRGICLLFYDDQYTESE